MPWIVTKLKGGKYRVKSKVSGRVAIVKGKKNLKGYLWHAEHAK